MAWTDERIDDAMARIDRGFDDMRQEMREMRAEMREMRTDLGGRIDSLGRELLASQRQQAVIGWGIAAALMAQLMAFVITQS